MRSPAWEFHAATSYGGRAVSRSTDPAPGETIALPAAGPPDPLVAAITRRISSRRFCPDPLKLDDLASLLESGYGIIGKARVGEQEFDHRPTPSAGAQYPLLLYVIARSVDGVEPGVYRHDPSIRTLEPVASRPDDQIIASLFLDQPWVSTASAIVVIVGEIGGLLERYSDRGYRYALFEAGHVAQNLALCAASLGVANLPLGGFRDEELALTLALDRPWAIPLYGAALGYLVTEDPVLSRSVG